MLFFRFLVLVPYVSNKTTKTNYQDKEGKRYNLWKRNIFLKLGRKETNGKIDAQKKT